MLLRLREDSLLLLGVLVGLNLLNAADLLFTLAALEAGAQEANPVLRPLFAAGPLAAGGFKATVVLAVSLLIWAGRRYRGLLEAGLLVTGVYLLVIVYHIWGLLAY